MKNELDLPALDEISIGKQSLTSIPYFSLSNLPNLTKLSIDDYSFLNTTSFSLTSISIIFVLHRSGKADPIEYFI